MNYNQTIRFYKKRAIKAECNHDWLRQELNLEEECHYDECESLRAELALLKQQIKQKGFH